MATFQFFLSKVDTCLRFYSLWHVALSSFREDDTRLFEFMIGGKNVKSSADWLSLPSSNEDVPVTKLCKVKS